MSHVHQDPPLLTHCYGAPLRLALSAILWVVSSGFCSDVLVLQAVRGCTDNGIRGHSISTFQVSLVIDTPPDSLLMQLDLFLFQIIRHPPTLLLTPSPSWRRSLF